MSGGELTKDSLHDGGLVRLDPPFAGSPLDQRVSVCLPAWDLAGQRTAELAAFGLLLQIGQVKLGHRAQQADVHCADLAKLHGVQRDTAELQPIVQISDLRQLASDAVQRLADDHIEFALLGVGDHLLILGPVRRRPRYRPVGIDLRHTPTPRLSVSAAYLDLVID
jgi:hypothetical protein